MQWKNRNDAIWDGPSMFWTPEGADAEAEQICKIRHLSAQDAVLRGTPAEVGARGFVGMPKGTASKAVVVEASGSDLTVRFIEPGEGFRDAVARMIPAVEGREPFVLRRSRLSAPIKTLADVLEQRIEGHIDTRRDLFDLDDFPWTRALMERAPEIRGEFQNVLQTFGAEGIKETADDAGAGPGWRVFPIARLGRRIDFTAAYCPVTAELVEHVPDLILASFSILLPGQAIPLHRAGSRLNLRFHLGLVVPDGDVGIEIDGVTHRWRECDGFIFDDRKYHHAWNHTHSPRGILMIDFPRSLPIVERSLTRAYVSLYVRFLNPELGSLKEWQKRVEGSVPRPTPQTV